MNDFELFSDEWKKQNQKLAFKTSDLSDFSRDIALHHQGRLIKPLSTGLIALEGVFKLFYGMLVLFTGYPGAGKSEILRFLAVQFVKEYGGKVAVFSPESFTAVLADEIVISMAGQPRNAQNGDIYETAQAAVQEHFIFLEIADNIGMPDGDQMIMQMEALISRGVKFFIIDPLNWLTTSNHTSMMYESLRILLTNLKQFADRNKVIVAYVEHPKTPSPNRDGEYPKANVFMVNGGIMHWKKCDGIVILHREKTVDEEGNYVMTTNDRVLFEVAKLKFQKYLGTPRTVELGYDYKTGNYYSL